MANYILLATFTEQGLKNIKGTVDRAQAASEAAKKHGVTVREVFWTQGKYDIALICQADNDTAATAFGLSVAQAGNVRFQTIRALDAAEMRQVLAKMP